MNEEKMDEINDFNASSKERGFLSTKKKVKRESHT